VAELQATKTKSNMSKQSITPVTVTALLLALRSATAEFIKYISQNVEMSHYEKFTLSVS